MTTENRKRLRGKIVQAVIEMTSEMDNRQSAITIGGHEIARRLIYAGGSQWCGCGRDWDSTESGWGWVVDGEYRLTVPDNLFGFDGHNMIERQTGYYLQDGYDAQTVPEHDGRNELDRVPNRILIEISKGLVYAVKHSADTESKENADAEAVLAAIC